MLIKSVEQVAITLGNRDAIHIDEAARSVDAAADEEAAIVTADFVEGTHHCRLVVSEESRMNQTGRGISTDDENATREQRGLGAELGGVRNVNGVLPVELPKSSRYLFRR